MRFGLDDNSSENEDVFMNFYGESETKMHLYKKLYEQSCKDYEAVLQRETVATQEMKDNQMKNYELKTALEKITCRNKDLEQYRKFLQDEIDDLSDTIRYETLRRQGAEESPSPSINADDVIPKGLEVVSESPQIENENFDVMKGNSNVANGSPKTAKENPVIASEIAEVGSERSVTGVMSGSYLKLDDLHDDESRDISCLSCDETRDPININSSVSITVDGMNSLSLVNMNSTAQSMSGNKEESTDPELMIRYCDNDKDDGVEGQVKSPPVASPTVTVTPFMSPPSSSYNSIPLSKKSTLRYF